MKKLFTILAVLVVLGVLALVAVGFFLGPIVTKAVNAVGPRITGTKVELASASVSPLTGGGTLKGLLVGNPAGWSGDKAIYLGEARASIQPASLLGSHILINEVFVDGPEIVFEKRLLGGSNIDALLKQIEANTRSGSAAAAPASGPEAKPGEPLKFAIKSFRIQNAKMSLVIAGKPITVPLPPLTITDLGVAEGGITVDQVAAQVLKRVLAQLGVAAAEAAKQVGGALLDGGADGAKSAKEAAKGALNKLLGK